MLCDGQRPVSEICGRIIEKYGATTDSDKEMICCDTTDSLQELERSGLIRRVN